MAKFRSSARSSGFNAIDLPDNAYRIQQAGQKRIDDLRTTYNQTIQNKKQALDEFTFAKQQEQAALDRNASLEETYRQTYEQALRKRYDQKLDKQKKQAEFERSRYDRLSQFSQEAGKLGAELYQQHKDKRQREGMSLIFHTGLKAEELQVLQQTEDGLLAEHTAANAIIERLKKNGATAGQIKQIRELDGWILLGAQKELAQNAGTAYHAFLKNPETRNRVVKLSDGSETTLEKAYQNIDEAAYHEVRGLLTSEFLQRYQGYNLAFAEQYIFPKMRDTKETDDLDFNTKLQEQFEKEERDRFYTNIVNLSDAMKSDPRAAETFLITESGNNPKAKGNLRRRMLEAIPEMIANGNIDAVTAEQFLSELMNQKLTVGGKEVTFQDQFFGRGSPDKGLLQPIKKAIYDIKLFNEKVEQQKENAFRKRMLDGAVKQATGDGLSDDEIKVIKSEFEKERLVIDGVLLDIMTHRSLPSDRKMQYQLALEEISLGGPLTEAQLAAKFPNLSVTQRQQLASTSSMAGHGGSGSGLKTYTDVMAQEIKSVMKTSNQIDPGAQTTGMIGIMQRQFVQDFIKYKNDPKTYGFFKDDAAIAQEILANHRKMLHADSGKGEGIYTRITSEDPDGTRKLVVGTGAGFVEVFAPGDVSDSPTWKRTIETIDNDHTVLSNKPLLGDMEDPNSWASQIPEIIKTGKPPTWLTNLARYTNTSWKILFNRQAALYGDYRLPLSRLEDAAEGISPGFLNSIGVAPTAAGVVLGSITQARAQGAQAIEVYRPLLNLIASYESSNDTVHGGYDAMNLGGTHGGSRAIGSNTGTVHFKKPLIEMTVGEIMDKQAAGELHAAGRYQFLGSTLQDVFDRGNPGGISRDSLFDAATQDKLAVTYIRMTMRAFPGDPTFGIRSRWIGVKDHLSYEETKQVVDRIQKDTRVQGTAFANTEIDTAIYAHSAGRK